MTIRVHHPFTGATSEPLPGAGNEIAGSFIAITYEYLLIYGPAALSDGFSLMEQDSDWSTAIMSIKGPVVKDVSAPVSDMGCEEREVQRVPYGAEI